MAVVGHMIRAISVKMTLIRALIAMRKQTLWKCVIQWLLDKGISKCKGLAKERIPCGFQKKKKKTLGDFWARMKQRSEVARDLVIQSLVDLGTNTGFEKVGVVLNKGEGRKERSRPQI